MRVDKVPTSFFIIYPKERKYMKKNKRFVLAFGLFVFALFSANAKKSKQPVVRIGSANGEGRPFSGLSAIAKEYGYFEEEFEKIGYKVEYYTFQNGIVVNEALLAKDIDFSIIGDVPGVTGFKNNIGVTWIASGSGVTHLSIVARKGAGIKKPEDLIGKSIGLNLGTNAQQLFENYIAENNLPREKLNILNITLANIANAIVTGDLDVGIGNSTTLLPLVANGEAEEVFSSTENEQWSAQTLITARKAFLKQNPQAGLAYVRALFRAEEEFKANPEKNYNIFSGKTLDRNPELGKVLFNPQNITARITEDYITKLQNLYEILRSVERVTGPFDVRTAIDTSYVEKVAKEWSEKTSKVTVASKN